MLSEVNPCIRRFPQKQSRIHAVCTKYSRVYLATFRIYKVFVSLKFVWCFQSVWNNHFCQYQFFVLQQASLLWFLSNYKEFWSCFVFVSVIIFLLKTRKISWLESWLLWVIKAERLLSVFVFNFAFWWLFVCLTKSIFMTIYFFVSSKLSFDTFLKLSFWSFLVFVTKAFLVAFDC